MCPYRLFTLVASTAVLSSGCWSENPIGGGRSVACGDFTCSDLLTIYVTRRDAARFPSGDYAFSIDGGALTAICDVETGQAIRCEEAADILSVDINPERDEFTLRLDGAPVEIAVEVLLSGDIIGTEYLVPSYRVIISDDPDCTASCLQGTEDIEVQAPPEE